MANITKMVSEAFIEAALEELEADERNYSAAFHEFGQRQPALLSFLFSEDAELLTEAERETMIFGAVVIFKAIELAQLHTPPKITEKQIGDAEEKNWELLENITAKRFRERMDIFFENTSQEDLLAFVEDILTEDEESSLSKEGREPVFVALKTLIDVLTQ
jgi:hypothetical protein